MQPQLLQRPPATHKRLSGAASQRADLLQIAMASQQAQCVRLVADALLEGRFSKVSVVLHMYEALQALIHDPQVCANMSNFLLLFNGLQGKSRSTTKAPAHLFLNRSAGCACFAPAAALAPGIRSGAELGLFDIHTDL